MALAEKIRFLANRVEDGEEFYWGDSVMKFDSIDMLLKKHNGEWLYSDIKVNTINYWEIKPKQNWEFTEDEKAILRNLPEKYNWIVRDGDGGTITVCDHLPPKNTKFYFWEVSGDSYIIPFSHIFKCIQWTDEEPCEFRKHI